MEVEAEHFCDNILNHEGRAIKTSTTGTSRLKRNMYLWLFDEIMCMWALSAMYTLEGLSSSIIFCQREERKGMTRR